MRIAVFGASGYTARLVIAELLRRELTPVLVGRHRDRLQDAARQAAGPRELEVREATLDDLTVLRGCDAVINCAGPFSATGELVIRGALAAGCHYLDLSGEQAYIKRVHDVFAEDGLRGGVTILPGATDDGVPGDLIARLTTQRIGSVAELTMAHRLVSGGLSRGSARTALANLESFERGGLTFEDGKWQSGTPARHLTFQFPDDSEPSPVVKFPAPEVATIPRHVRVTHVEGVIDAGTFAPLRVLTAELVASMPDGPAEDRRRAARFTIVAQAEGDDGRCARGVVHGNDMYGTTAIIAVEAARRLIAGRAPAGVLAPAQAFEAVELLNALEPHGLRWQVLSD